MAGAQWGGARAGGATLRAKEGGTRREGKRRAAQGEGEGQTTHALGVQVGSECAHALVEAIRSVPEDHRIRTMMSSVTVASSSGTGANGAAKRGRGKGGKGGRAKGGGKGKKGGHGKQKGATGKRAKGSRGKKKG